MPIGEELLTTNLRAALDVYPHMVPWARTLDATRAMVAERWSLAMGDAFEPGGNSAWVAPVTTADGQPAVVKIGFRHPEGEHEAAGLRLWDGRGCVRVLESMATTDSIVLLLERCMPGTTLRDRPEPEQDEVIAEMLRRLWIAPPPGHRFRTLAAMCEEWADEFEAHNAARPAALDPAHARDGIALLRELPRSAEQAVLLCTDLHAGNVLQAERAPWLMIDPKPHVGDPTYDALQHMLNCPARLQTDPVDFTDRMAELLDLDRERLRLWLFARCVQQSWSWPHLTEAVERLAD